MHVLVAFMIIAGLFTSVYKEHIAPENEFTFMTGLHDPVTLRAEISPQSDILMQYVIKQNYDYSCGSAALATLLNYSLGEELTEKQVVHGLLKYGDVEQIRKLRAFSLYDMQCLCAMLGYDAQGYRAELKELENPLYWPCIVPITLTGYRHFVVLKGIYNNHVFVADPYRGNSSYTLNDFEKLWDDNIIFLVAPDIVKKRGLDFLQLSQRDLRYVSEDTARDLINNTLEPFQFPPEFEANDIPGEWQFGRPPYY